MIKTKKTGPHKIQRFVLYGCPEYEGGCGWNDYQADSNNLEQLKKYLADLKVNAKYRSEWNCIVDLRTGCIIK